MKNLVAVISVCLVGFIVFFCWRNPGSIDLRWSLAILLLLCFPLFRSAWQHLRQKKMGIVSLLATLSVLMLLVANVKAETGSDSGDVSLKGLFSCKQLGVGTQPNRTLEEIASKVSRGMCPSLRSDELEAVESLIKEAFDTTTGKARSDWIDEVRHRIEESNHDACCTLKYSEIGVVIFTVKLGKKSRDFAFSQKEGFMCEEIHHAHKEARK